MPQRRSSVVEATQPLPTPLRRSPRLRHLVIIPGIQNPKSNNIQVHPISDSSPIRKNPNRGNFSKDSDKSRVFPRNSDKSFKGLKKSNRGSVNNGKSANGSPRKSRFDSKFEGLEGLRKSPRLCNKVNSLVHLHRSPKRVVVQMGVCEGRERNQFKGKESRSTDSPKLIICGLASTPTCEVDLRNSKRMITRSASKSKRERDDSCRQVVEIRCTSTSRNVARKATTSTLKAITSQPPKRATRNSAVSSCRGPEGEMGLLSIEGNEKENGDCNLEGENKKQKLIGNKRKRKQAGTDQGWTKEQEVALQRAYFAAKPSPHFWKRVSKLVPGKSSQECFDKMHSDNLTPVSTRRSSRAKKSNSPSDLSVPGCNLFKSPEAKSKKLRKTKQKSHIARRTVRHLLQKYSKVNQDNESDLFSILEPAVNPSHEVLQKNTIQSTPQHVLRSPGSSSKREKHASRFRSASKSPLTSPPVLKKMKNMALHEKYIDQLHKREAKRKVQSSRYVKLVPCQKGEGENPVATKNAIKAAKDALVSDARDAINKFRDLQANIMDSFYDSEEEGLVDPNEDDGVVL